MTREEAASRTDQWTAGLLLACAAAAWISGAALTPPDPDLHRNASIVVEVATPRARGVVLEGSGEAAECFLPLWERSRSTPTQVSVRDLDRQGRMQMVALDQYQRRSLYTARPEVELPLAHCLAQPLTFRASGLPGS